MRGAREPCRTPTRTNHPQKGGNTMTTRPTAFPSPGTAPAIPGASSPRSGIASTSSPATSSSSSSPNGGGAGGGRVQNRKAATAETPGGVSGSASSPAPPPPPVAVPVPTERAYETLRTELDLARRRVRHYVETGRYRRVVEDAERAYEASRVQWSVACRQIRDYGRWTYDEYYANNQSMYCLQLKKCVARGNVLLQNNKDKIGTFRSYENRYAKAESTKQQNRKWALALGVIGSVIFVQYSIWSMSALMRSAPSHVGGASGGGRRTVKTGSAAMAILQKQIALPEINPFRRDDQYPKAIPLSEGANDLPEYVQRRHTCIRHVREKQTQVLGPLLQESIASFRKVLLVDPAYGAKNIGDQMLTLAEITFLRRMGYYNNDDDDNNNDATTTATDPIAIDGTDLLRQEDIQQCGYLQSGGYVPNCTDFYRLYDPTSLSLPNGTRVPALWHAGGNWGASNRPVHESRLESFEPLLRKGFSIVGMPQTLDYDKPWSRLSKRDANRFQRAMGGGLGQTGERYFHTEEGIDEGKSRVALAWRDTRSLAEAKKLYPFVRHVLCPDIAFQLGPYRRVPPPAVDHENDSKVDVLMFLRDDKESTLIKGKKSDRNDAFVRNKFNTIDGASNLTFRIVDWNSRTDMLDTTATTKKDPLFSEADLQLLSLGKVVVCDRLQVAILCYLSGIPFVYMDPANGKISQTFDTAFDTWEGCKDGGSSLWSRSTSLPDAIQKATGLLKKV